MEEIVKIIIPSHKRHDRVTTLKVVNNPTLVVHKSQKDIYEEHNPGIEVIGVDAVGIGPTRAWIYEHFGNIFMLDDDITGMHRLYTAQGEDPKVDPETAYDLIQMAAQVCKSAGLYLFGFNKNLNPLAYNSHNPFALQGYVNGCAMGLLKSEKLYFNTDFNVSDDFWMSLFNAYHYRKAWIDLRFSFLQKDTFTNQGGASDYRTVEVEKEDFIKLKKAFGDAIQLKGDTQLRELKHAYERTIHLPY